MKPFELTRKAKNDLQAIAIYTQNQWGKDKRNLHIKQFDDAFHLLTANPAIGKTCDEILPHYRKYPQGSHIIFYITGTNCAVNIIRILHKSMDAESKFPNT